jgi:hypothetical protein
VVGRPHHPIAGFLFVAEFSDEILKAGSTEREILLQDVVMPGSKGAFAKVFILY